MPFAKINGIDLYYESHGDGPPVVMSHGAGSNHVSWWRQVFDLASEFTVVTYDLRGFGLSGEDGRGGDAPVDDLAGLIDHLGLDRVMMVGQSLGGIVAGAYTSRHPEKVKALVLTSSRGSFAGGRPANEARPEPVPYAQRVGGMLGMDGFRERNPQTFMLAEEIAGLNVHVNASALDDAFQIKGDVGVLVEANIPVLLINGEDDPRGTTGHMKKIEEQIPNSRFELITDAGHLAFCERPEAYNELLLGFLREHAKDA